MDFLYFSSRSEESFHAPGRLMRGDGKFLRDFFGWMERREASSSCGCDERNFIEANFNIVFYEGKSLLLCVSFSLSLFEYLLVYFLSLRRRRKVYQCKSLLFISRPRQELFSSAMKI